jgi:hypothetical protein
VRHTSCSIAPATASRWNSVRCSKP